MPGIIPFHYNRLDFAHFPLLLIYLVLLSIIIYFQKKEHDGFFTRFSPKPNGTIPYPNLTFFLTSFIPSASRADVLLYSLRSYKAIQVLWTDAYIFLDLEGDAVSRRDEIKTAVNELFSDPSTKVLLKWFRPVVQEEWKETFESIAGNGGHGAHKLVFFIQNDDHPFVDFNSDVLHEGLSLMAADLAPFVSMYFSHWPEILRMSGKLKTHERVGKAFVRFEGTLLDAIQVFKSQYLWFIFQQLDWKNRQIKRIDGHTLIWSLP